MKLTDFDLLHKEKQKLKTLYLLNSTSAVNVLPTPPLSGGLHSREGGETWGWTGISFKLS